MSAWMILDSLLECKYLRVTDSTNNFFVIKMTILKFQLHSKKTRLVAALKVL
jgi:hypothetical protein